MVSNEVGDESIKQLTPGGQSSSLTSQALGMITFSTERAGKHTKSCVVQRNVSIQ